MPPSVRELDVSEVTRAVREACIEINYKLPEEMVVAIRGAREQERSPVGREILDQLVDNAELAAQGEYPYCQDTGSTVVFVDVGQDVHLVGGGLAEAVDEGVRQGYRDGYLRASIVRDPLFDRTNTGDNTPAFVHTRVVPGDRVAIVVDAKGGGSENMSRHAMLRPADGIGGVKRFVMETVEKAGASACPPGIAGVGVGGTFEMAAELAKRALMRPVGTPNPDAAVAAFETELLDAAQQLGLGPQAMGGTVTLLAVHVETAPTHITSLPVAVNMECHAHRTRTVVL